MEVALAKIEERLLEILKRQDELSHYQREMNGRVAVHQTWIDRREREIDATDDRFKMVDEVLDSHQSWIDRAEQRYEMRLREFDGMRETIASHSEYIGGQKAVKTGFREFIKDWGSILGAAVIILKLFKVIP